MKSLPLSIQSLKKIIDKGAIYVDKTDLISDLIQYEQVFLSRPRRFGKSLFLDTLEEVFRGNADLFSGLKIADSGYEFKKYPVIRLNMAVNSRSPEILEKRLLEILAAIAAPYPKVSLRSADPGGALQGLIEDISVECGEKVVALVDEYDYPVSKYIDNLPLAEANTDVLSSCYVGFKDMDKYLRFVMVTGVTRYAMMGLSAGLNQLVDISFDPKYATICGFTPDELDQYFGDRYSSTLETLKSTDYLPPESSEADLRQEILNWYDGYTWDGKTRVLNPISILNFFNLREFKEFWKTNYISVNFLQNTISSNPLSFTQYKLQGYVESDISLASVGNLASVPLLFHTGYLTIDKIIRVNKKLQYSFRVPNFELKDSFYNILNDCLHIKDRSYEAEELTKALRERDSELLTHIIVTLFSRIPSEHYKNNEDMKESFFHMALLCYCSGLLEARAEEPGPLGDLDLLLITPDGLHAVIELKYAQILDPADPEKTLNNLVKKAFSVIKKKKYGSRYRLPGRDIVPIGLGVGGRGEAKAVFASPQIDIT
ncbi:MAG: AAA family ATPase [Deltaproteobacteria bacterium]|jgi:hypothetical protein|nr:AAA family ATPase [Deltaproteobacteria bacterium]